SSQYGLDLLFEAPAEEQGVSAASEGGCKPSEADVSSELTTPAAESQTVADAEVAAALQWAAWEIGLEWVPPPRPEPSRLDDWFLGNNRDSRPHSSPVPFFPEVHKNLTKWWKAPLLARAQYTNSSSFSTLEGGPARGYKEVPQVERAIAMHLCPQNATSWRGRPRLPSRACKFSFTLIAKAYTSSGQAASALHAMAILQVYQAKVLIDLHEGFPNPKLLQELRSATDYALQATKVTAQALGRAMSTMVVQERHLWLNLAEMLDAEKVRFLDAPISQAGLHGETVKEFVQQFSTVKKQTEAIKHILSQCVASASPAPPRQQPPPAPHRGRPLREQLRPRRKLILQLDPPNGPALAGRLQRTLVRLQSIPETGSPGKEDRLTGPGPHSTSGRATWQMATTCHTPLVFPHVPKQRVRSDGPPCQGDPLFGSHHTNSLGKTASDLRGFLPPDTGRFSSHSFHMAANFLDSLWLAPQDHLTWLCNSLHETPAQVPQRSLYLSPLCGHVPSAEETVPSAEMKKGFYRALPVAEAALASLREVGICILNYLNDWLILAYSRNLVCSHRDVILNHLAHLGLRDNWKRANSPQRRNWTRTRTVSAEVCGSTQTQVSSPPETISEAPGAHGILSRSHAAGSDAHETATALASYPSPEMGIVPQHVLCEHHTIVLQNTQPLARHFVQSGVPLEQVSRRIIVTTDASKTGWGAVCNGHAASGVWTGSRLPWHINCLELLTVLLALKRFRPLIQGKHVLVRSDNTATVAYINLQGGVRSFRMSQLARHLLLWSQHSGLCVPLKFPANPIV
ncbi:hypothetical protein M9458_028361, partial [Cirrhinus mrigala]